MDIKEFALKHIGEKVTYGCRTGIIVGYNTNASSYNGESKFSVIIGLIDKDGWGSLDEEDIIILDNNCLYYWYVPIDEITKSSYSQWIDVKSDCPESDYNVFYANKFSGALGVAYYLNGKWYEAYRGDTIYGITHWMKPPKF